MKEKIKKLAEEVMGVLGPGLKEDPYEKALSHELRLNNIPYTRQRNIEIIYRGYYLKDVKSDIIVDDKLLLELKTAKPNKDHVKQAQVYMHSLNIDEGMVIGFQKDGNVGFIDVAKPELPSFRISVDKRMDIKANIDIEEELISMGRRIMDYFGTEFMFTDAKFDIYISALKVELILAGFNPRGAEVPVMYKNHVIATEKIDLVIENRIGIVPIQVKKENDIQSKMDSINRVFPSSDLEKIYILTFPSSEKFEMELKKIE